MSLGESKGLNRNLLSRFDRGDAGKFPPSIYLHQAGAAHLQAATVAPEAQCGIDLLLDAVEENEDRKLFHDRYPVLLIAGRGVVVRVVPVNQSSNRFSHEQPPDLYG